MWVNFLILLVFLIMLSCLVSAAVTLTKTTKKDRAVVFAKLLTWRIALAVGLFVFLFVAFYLGWIHPHYP